MADSSVRWRHRLIWFPLILLIVNIAVVWPLFHVEYLSQNGTGEPLTMAYARWARDNWPDIGWCRFWFGGMPFQNAYVPGLHLTVALLSWLGGISVAHAFHFVVATMYSLGPVMLFFLAYRLSGTAGWSFAAALLYSLFSPSALLVPEIRTDLGGLFRDQRLHTMVTYSDNPHVSALALLPLAILALDVALARRKPLYYVLAALALSAVALTNIPGAIALAGAVAAYSLSMTRSWLRLAAMGALAYAYVAPWLPPSTIRTTQAAAQTTAPEHRFNPHHLLYYGVLAVAVILMLRLFAALRLPAYLRFFILFFLIMAAFTLGHYWFGVALIAEPHRFHLAMEIGFTLSLVFLVKLAIERRPALVRPLAAIFALFCVVQLVQYRAYARGLIHGMDITRTSEYKTARWFDAHMRDSRVMVPGSTTFWLNLFTDTPQLTGCCMQSVLTENIPYANFGITTDLNAESRAYENSMLWFKALGVRAVAVSGPRSTEFYKPFLHPHKFDGKLPERWRDGDDVIFEVPWRFYSLAHAMRPSDLVQRTPVHGVDTDPLVPYVAAIERPDAPDLRMRWLDNETAEISGHVPAGQVVSVQETGHFGWHATVGGVPRRVFTDKIGFLAVVPECSGECTIRLHYDGGMEMRAAHWISGLALAGSLLWILFAAFARPAVRNVAATAR